MEFKESDIRPVSIVEGQQKYIEADRSRLLQHKDDFVLISCPACDSKKSAKALVKNELTYFRCSQCSTLYVNPRPTAAILEECYANSEVYAYWNEYMFPASDTVRREHIFKPRVKRLASICEKYGIENATLLEVGAAFGTFCEEAKSCDIFRRIIAVEPTPDLAETCRRKGLEVIERPIEQVEFEQGSIDVVASFEVLEHLFSPKEFLLSCSSLLSPGGILVISCPSSKGFEITVLQELADTIDHEHLNYFNPDSLSLLVANCGFDVLEVLTPGVLDADIVRNKILAGALDVSCNPFLQQVLIDDWKLAGDQFQQFLSDNLLSTHMWMVASKK
ncbi:Ubiquinone biosynthesis O-methyltransferase, mitochondrial [subsurface metagenome]